MRVAQKDSLPLPLHRNQNTKPSPTQKLSAAVEAGLGMVGMAATKSGSGEKEKAYIVRQNSVLKLLLFIVIVVCVGSMIAFTTVYELSVARRGLIKSEAFHHKKEHHDHEALIRAHMELQQVLEVSLEEIRGVENVRSYFDKSVGEASDAVDKLFEEAGGKPELLARVKATQATFVRGMDMQLQKLIHRFRNRMQHGHEKLNLLAKIIGREVNDDVRDDKIFDKKMEDMGVDEQYADELAHEEEVEEEEDYKEEHDGKKMEDADDLGEDATKEIERSLEAFFEKLNRITIPEVTLEVSTSWKKALDQIVETMEDPNKEVDLDAAARKMEELIAQTVRVNPPKFDPKQHDSPVEFFEAFIEEARVMPHKAALLDLYKGWKTPDSEITANTVLANIEKLAEEYDLWHLFDWLDGVDPDPLTEFDPDAPSQPVAASGAASGAATVDVKAKTAEKS